jgi:hypothetical protein
MVTEIAWSRSSCEELRGVVHQHRLVQLLVQPLVILSKNPEIHSPHFRITNRYISLPLVIYGLNKAFVNIQKSN